MYTSNISYTSILCSRTINIHKVCELMTRN